MMKLEYLNDVPEADPAQTKKAQELLGKSRARVADALGSASDALRQRLEETPGSMVGFDEATDIPDTDWETICEHINQPIEADGTAKFLEQIARKKREEEVRDKQRIVVLETALGSLQEVVRKMQVSMIGMYERLAALENERPKSALILPDRMN